jgi:hypothetical protein
MKKFMAKKFLTFLAAGIIFLLAGGTEAATNFSFSPLKIEVKEGQTFNLNISANPQGVKNYTVKASIKFPADLVALKTWTYTDSWMPLKNSGYDYFNNESGSLIRTAGYPGGFDKTSIFGSMVFVAKKSGIGIIEIGTDSFVLDGASQNVFGNAAARSSIIITALLPPAEQPIPPAEEAPVIPAEEVVPSSSASALFDVLTQPGVKQSQGNFLIPVLFGVGILMIVIVGYVIYRKKSRKIIQ